MTPVKIKDLPDLVTRDGWRGPRPFLYCNNCGERRSANWGDYFQCDPEQFIECGTCLGLNNSHEPMELATEHVVLVPWPPEDGNQETED